MPNQPSRIDDESLTRQALSMIRIQEAGSLAGSVGRLLLGTGACMLMGLVAATVVTTCLFTLAGTSFIGWSGWFFFYLLALVPALIWQERRSRVDYLYDGLRSIDPNPSSRAEYEMNKGAALVAFYSAFMVWGPRALIDGFRGMRGLRTTAQHAVIDRAAALVVDLTKAGEGVEIKKLIRKPEDMQVFGSAVDLLDKHRWIGKSSDGHSMWLNSTFRDKLISQLNK